MLFDLNGRPAGEPNWNKDPDLEQKLTNDERIQIVDKIVEMIDRFVAAGLVIPGRDGKPLMANMILNEIHPFRNHHIFKPLEEKIGGEAAIGILGVLLWESIKKHSRKWTFYDPKTNDHRQMQYFL